MTVHVQYERAAYLTKFTLETERRKTLESKSGVAWLEAATLASFGFHSD